MKSSLAPRHRLDRRVRSGMHGLMLPKGSRDSFKADARRNQPVSKREVHRASIDLGAIITPVPVILDVPFFPFVFSKLHRQIIGHLHNTSPLFLRRSYEVGDDVAPLGITAEVRFWRIVGEHRVRINLAHGVKLESDALPIHFWGRRILLREDRITEEMVSGDRER
jgi:hypothetical protein